MHWLDFDGRRLTGARPFMVWEWPAASDTSSGDPLNELREIWAASRQRFPTGGMIGYFAYDFARSLEPRAFAHDAPSPANDLPLPTARWTFFEELIHDGPMPALHASPARSKASATPYDTDGDYENSVHHILDLIAAGDIYQANLTRRFSAPLHHTPRSLYEELQRTPMPMSALLEDEDFALVSHSPERFWSLKDGRVSAHPIKGTRPRGATSKEDEAQRQALATSAKDRAENVMIVDLLRNDLGRVCDYGSIAVPQIFEACPYPTVWHGVSTVTGTMDRDRDVFDLIHATFPCGSITGAPKIRAMQIIDSLEPVRRGAAMGAIGYIDFQGNADFNVAIRTATCIRDRIYFHAGGGIVADSDPAAEREEIEVKTRAIRAVL